MRQIYLFNLAIVTILLTGCQTADPIREATIKMKPAFDAYIYAWNSGKLDTLDAVFDQNVIRYEGMTTINRGLDSIKLYITGYRTMFPDFKVTVEEVFFFGDHAVCRIIMSGTNTGPGDIPPTGKSFKLSGLDLFRFVNGKIAEERLEADGISYMQQLGFTLVPKSE